MKKVFLAFCALSAAGCTTQLDTRPGGVGVQYAAVGVPYALPKARHELTVTRTLVGCQVDAAGAISGLEFETTIKHEPKYVAGERFVVDYRALGTWHKTSAFKLETHPNQTIKSINANAEDRSPEILATTVKTALTIANIANTAGVASLAPAYSEKFGAEMLSEMQRADIDQKYVDMARLLIMEGALPTLPKCPSEVADLAKTTAALKKKSEELLAAVRELDAVVIPGLIGMATEEQKKEVQALVKKINELGKQQAALQRQHDALSGRLGFTESFAFEPKTSGNLAGRTFLFPSENAELATIQSKKLRALFGLGEASIPADLLGLIRQFATVSASLEVIEEDSVSICGSAGVAVGCDAPSSPDWGRGTPKAIPGIAYRQPAHARLRVCKAQSVVECARGSVQPALLDLTVSVPQLGKLVILPFENGFGANNSISAVFREDGSLDWLSYGVKEAVGENVAGFLGDSSDQLLAYRTDRREQKEQALEDARAAPAKALDDQIAILERQQALAQLVAASDPGAVSQQLELGRLQAEIARLTALRQIMELEAALEAGD